MRNELTKKEDNELKLNPQGFVTLPFNQEDFKEFVVGLLGKPQTIDNIIDGPFIINVDDLKNIYSLLNQRILQQNEATLIQFNARISFSDKSSVLLNSIDELLSYNEIRPLISNEVHLTLQYLIKFKDKKVPEKQEINLTFISSKVSKMRREMKFIDAASPYMVLSRLYKEKWENGFIQYSIKHTARTWGTDIDNLLSKHLLSFIQEETGLRKFVRRNMAFINFIMFFGILGMGIYFSTYINRNLTQKSVGLIQAAFKLGGEDLKAISEQVKFVAQNKQTDSSVIIFFLIFISFFLAVLSLITMDEAISKRKDSFILLTKEAEKNKIKIENAYNSQWQKFAISIVMSIICSIVANYLFVYFTK